MASVSIVIPAFNEEGAIGPVIDSIKALPLDAEIIVVDDASTDRTVEVAAQHGAQVVHHPVNTGYGRSVKDGIRAAATDVIITSDADGTYPIEQIPILLQKFNEGFDMVVGARQGRAYRGSLLKMLARIVLKLIVEFTTGRKIPDVNSGFRVLRKQTAMPFFPDICDGFSFTTTITLVYLLTHRSVAYIPVPYHKRVGRSKVHMFHDTLRTLQYITECIVRYNPLKLFMAMSIFTLLVGAIAMIWLGLWALFIAALVVPLIVGLGLLAESMRRPRA